MIPLRLIFLISLLLTEKGDMSERIDTLPENLQAARLLVCRHRPYLASLIWALVPISKTKKEHGLDSMAVDRYGRWYINLEEVTTWAPSKAALGIIHECNHLLRRHHDRMTVFDEWITPQGISLANLGGDLEINDGLEEEAKDFNATLPDNWLYPKSFGFEPHLLAEE